MLIKLEQRHRSSILCRRANLSVEFALALPVLLLLLGAVFDLSNAFIAWRRMTVAADAATQIATNFLANSAISPGNVTLQSPYALQATNAVFDYFPEWINAPTQKFSITLSSVQATSPTTATTVWTYSSPHANVPAWRACSLTAATTTSLSTLPAGVLQSPYVIVADVSYTYTPVLLKMLAPNGFALTASAYMTPRVFSVAAPIGYNPLPDPNVHCTP